MDFEDRLTRRLSLALVAAAGVLALATAPPDPLALLAAFAGWAVVLLCLAGAAGCVAAALAAVVDAPCWRRRHRR